MIDRPLIKFSHPRLQKSAVNYKDQSPDKCPQVLMYMLEVEGIECWRGFFVASAWMLCADATGKLIWFSSSGFIADTIHLQQYWTAGVEGMRKNIDQLMMK